MVAMCFDHSKSLLRVTPKYFASMTSSKVGYKSRWWARCNHVCDKFGLWELVNLLWLKNINKEGMIMLGMKYNRNVWKKTLVARIQEDCRRQWRNGFGINEREQQYVHMQNQPKKREICKWQCGSESEINGQRRLPSSKRFLRNGKEI